MTGLLVRVRRNAGYEALDIAELTDGELKEFFEDVPPEMARKWARALAGWIRDNVTKKGAKT